MRTRFAGRIAALTGIRRPDGAVALAAGAVVFGLVIAMVGAADLLFPGDPLDMVAAPFSWPGADPAYPLGTDALGRDMAAGIVHGARVSLLVGVVATLLAVVLGTTVGLLSGYYGGWADQCLMRVTEMFQLMPPFLFAVVLIAVLQPSLASIVVSIGLTAWPNLARIVRAEVMRLRGGDLVNACITIGMHDARIMGMHILPNIVSPVISVSSIMVATAILTESSLSFLGLGDPNLVSWGGMVGAGREVLRTDWYIAALPGLAIILSVLALNLLGDGLHAALEPRARRR